MFHYKKLSSTSIFSTSCGLVIEKIAEEDFGQWQRNFTYESQKGTKTVTKTSILSTPADDSLEAREVEFKPNVEFIKLKKSQNRKSNKMSGEVKDILKVMNVEEELPSVGFATEKTVTVVPIGNGIMRKTMRVVSKRMMKNGVIKTKTMSQRHEDYRGDSSLDFDELLVCFVDRRSFKIRYILFDSSIVSLISFFEDLILFQWPIFFFEKSCVDFVTDL